MPTELNNYLIQEIRKSIAPDQNVAEILSELLHQSKANIYNKINGNSPFSSEETITIVRTFNISLDRYALNVPNMFQKVVFDYSFPIHTPTSPTTFLEKILTDLEQITLIPQANIAYASNEIPIFHSLVCPHTLAFKLYVWARSNWELPFYKDKKFDSESFYREWPAIEEMRKEAAHLYSQIPSKEYWTRNVIDNILNQIRYYENNQLFLDDHMPQKLRKELFSMLEQREKNSGSRTKTDLSTNYTSAALDLYLNEIAYTNNIILIYQGATPIAFYATMDNPNFMKSTDPVMVQRMHHWLLQIEARSFNTVQEQSRLNLFRYLKNKIEPAEIELGLY
ncbi:MAG: hypothetical protein JNJ57_12660 [Saprospiraceae bacterium]|nr:hypothetical protein [Saprospiraceae bacterium]